MRGVLELIERPHEKLASLPPVTLADGTVAKMSTYYEPCADEHGEWHAGVDVDLSNGVSLEFTLRNTGWGKALVERPPRREPQR